MRPTTVAAGRISIVLFFLLTVAAACGSEVPEDVRLIVQVAGVVNGTPFTAASGFFRAEPSLELSFTGQLASGGAGASVQLVKVASRTVDEPLFRSAYTRSPGPIPVVEYFPGGDGCPPQAAAVTTDVTLTISEVAADHVTGSLAAKFGQDASGAISGKFTLRPESPTDVREGCGR
jgi:hypothetical protein